MKTEVKQISFEGNVLKRFRELKTAISENVILKNIESGFIQFFGVFADSFLIGCIVTRIDTNYNLEKELVIMYTFTMYDRNDLNFVSLLNPIYDDIARTANIKRIRVHSERRGHDILLEKNGYKFLETVFIKELSL